MLSLTEFLRLRVILRSVALLLLCHSCGRHCGRHLLHVHCRQLLAAPKYATTLQPAASAARQQQKNSSSRSLLFRSDKSRANEQAMHWHSNCGRSVPRSLIAQRPTTNAIRMLPPSESKQSEWLARRTDGSSGRSHAEGSCQMNTSTARGEERVHLVNLQSCSSLAQVAGNR